MIIDAACESKFQKNPRMEEGVKLRRSIHCRNQTLPPHCCLSHRIIVLQHSALFLLLITSSPLTNQRRLRGRTKPRLQFGRTVGSTWDRQLQQTVICLQYFIQSRLNNITEVGPLEMDNFDRQWWPTTTSWWLAIKLPIPYEIKSHIFSLTDKMINLAF